MTEELPLPLPLRLREAKRCERGAGSEGGESSSSSSSCRLAPCAAGVVVGEGEPRGGPPALAWMCSARAGFSAAAAAAASRASRRAAASRARRSDLPLPQPMSPARRALPLAGCWLGSAAGVGRGMGEARAVSAALPQRKAGRVSNPAVPRIPRSAHVGV